MWGLIGERSKGKWMALCRSPREPVRESAVPERGSPYGDQSIFPDIRGDNSTSTDGRHVSESLSRCDQVYLIDRLVIMRSFKHLTHGSM
jgi:hypothetical protein